METHQSEMYFILCLALLLPSALANCKCGRKAPHTRIVGGKIAKDGQFPWMAHVKQDIFWSDGNKTSYVCGGSIINSEWVLTAGHCVSTDHFRREGSYITKVEFFVAVGMADVSPMYAESLYELDGGKRVPKQHLPRGIHYVSKAVLHQSYFLYSDGSIEDDIGLLKVAKAFQFSPNVAPVCLETKEGFYPTLEIAGWGSQGTNKPTEDHLRYTTVGQIEYCSVKIKDWKQICTRNGYYGTCGGDSGGPYVVYKRGVYYQVALVSYGAGTCEDPDSPQIDTKVSFYNDWIQWKVDSGYWCTP